MMIRTIILLSVGIAVTGVAQGQQLDKASHKVTVERIAETQVLAPTRVQLSSENLARDAGQLEIKSNVPLLKVVFSLVEPPDLNAAAAGDADLAIARMREVYSFQEVLPRATEQRLDLKEIIQELPDEFRDDEISSRRLVFTITQ
ncbi:MAG: hypothetical protein HKN37_17215 [Rhodothermales bacterium]|nr:hypothetical protein [Rhodothermales bacterium]